MNAGRIVQWLILTYAILTVLNWSPAWRDDTDEPGWFGQRSEVVLVTDHATGCQYLRVSWGGITPRLNARGEHVGCKKY